MTLSRSRGWRVGLNAHFTIVRCAGLMSLLISFIAFPRSVRADDRANAGPVAPAEAERILKGRVRLALASPVDGTATPGVEHAIDDSQNPEIKELARGLKNDPDLIYQYVRDYIEFVPLFGSLRGVSATLWDRKGTDFDQAALMIALLRAAGYDARFVYGQIRVQFDAVANWTGANDAGVASSLFGSGGIPSVRSSSSQLGTYYDVSHAWVKVKIGNTDYVFDPAFKVMASKVGIDLASAMGYDRSALVTAATSGSTATTDYVQGINRTNIRNTLAIYSANLVRYIRNNAHGATLEEIIGGRTAVLTTAATPLRQTTLPNQLTVSAEFSEIPATYRHTLRLQHAGIDTMLYSDEICGKRLTIFYSSSNQPILRLDGATVATGTAVTNNSSQSITLTVDHPYAGNSSTYSDQTRTFSISAGGTNAYSVVNGWGVTGRGTFERRRKALSEAMAAGNASTSEPVLGESLTMIGVAWLAERDRTSQIADSISSVFTLAHHSLGVAGQNRSPYVDLPMNQTSTVSNRGRSGDGNAVFFLRSGHASAFEWGAIAQLQPFSAVCTTKLLDLAISNGQKVFDVTSANYSTVKPQLKNYSSSSFASVEGYINSGNRVILPESGDLGEDQWHGIGFKTISSDGNSIGEIISGGLSGGYGTTNGQTNANSAQNSGNQGTQPDSHTKSLEPIDLVTGDYLYDHTDLTIGNGPYPFTLDYRRVYNSGARLRDGRLGLGWTDNLDIKVFSGSDGFQGLGEDSPIDAVPAIVELFVSFDLLNGTRPVENIAITTVAQRWFMDQLIGNTVTVQNAGSSSQFVLLPDGSYNPPPGVAATLTKNGDGTFRLRHKDGRALDFNSQGNASAWSDPNGNRITFSYSGANLTGIANGKGRSFALTYTGSRVTQVADNTGRSVSYTYDSAGNLVSYKDAAGNTTRFEYSGNGLMTRTFYPTFPSTPFMVNTYDTNGRVQSQANANGHVYNYYYSGFRTEELDPEGASKVWRFDVRGNTVAETDGVGNTTTSDYDGQRRRVKRTMPEGNSDEFTYDQSHNLTRVQKKPKPGSTLAALATTMTYESAFGRLKTITDPLGRTTTLSYDNRGNLTLTERPAVEGGTPRDQIEYDEFGRPVRTVNATGRVTTMGYDSIHGRPTSTTVDPAGFRLVVENAFDARGDVLTTTEPLKRVTEFQYDALRRRTQVKNAAGYITRYTYDADDRLTKTENQTGDTANPLQTVTQAYSPTGQVLTVADPKSNTTTFAYDRVDRLVSTTNPLSRVTRTTYDKVGRKEQIVDALGNVAAQWRYSANGLVLELKDANGNSTIYAYDGFDRLSSTTYPDKTAERLVYNAASNVSQRQTRAGQMINYTYDQLNRLVTKLLPDARLEYRYDLSGQLVGTSDVGGATVYEYDSSGRLAATVYPRDKRIGYQYDVAGNRTRLTYPDGFFVAYSYDSINRLQSAAANGSEILARYTYDARSHPKIVTRGNGASTTYSFEIDDRIKSISHQATDATTLFNYAYDKGGDQTSVDVSDPRFLFTPTASAGSVYATNVLNQYTGVSGVALLHDANGNLAKDFANSYTYNAENQLVTVAAPQRSVNYTYDASGRRIGKTVDGVAVTYLYDGLHIIAEYDASDRLVRRYIHSATLDQPIAMTGAGGAYYYYHFDAIGSAVLISSPSGTSSERYAYDSYGRVSSPSAIGNPFLFTGREYDSESETYGYRARTYSPILGRFLQTDPIGYRDGPNPYAYCQNNPLNLIDPLGLASIGAPGFWESLIPVWGSGRAAINDFQNGNWGWGTVNLALAVTDVFLVKSLVIGLGKLAAKEATVIAVESEALPLIRQSLRFTPDQQALVELAKQAERTGGVTAQEAQILKDWAKEVNLSFRGPEVHPNRPFGQFPHVHVGPVDHLPVKTQ